jgi:hypothetical protein
MARRKKPARKSAPARQSDRVRDAKIQRYRSLVLDKIRSDIALKRAALALVSKVSIPDLGAGGYWKSKYWKMKYWKMKYWKKSADMLDFEEVINPATTIIAERNAIASRRGVGAAARARAKRTR